MTGILLISKASTLSCRFENCIADFEVKILLQNLVYDIDCCDNS